MCTDIIKNSLGNPQPNTEDSFFPNSFLHDIYTSSFMFKSNCDQELRFLRCKWNLNEGNDDLKNEDLFLLWFIAIYLRGPGKTKKSLTNTSWKNKSIFQILYPSTSFRPCLLLLWPWHNYRTNNQILPFNGSSTELARYFYDKKLDLKAFRSSLRIAVVILAKPFIKYRNSKNWKEAAVWWTWPETESELHYITYSVYQNNPRGGDNLFYCQYSK